MRIYLDMDDTLMAFRDYAIARGVPAWAGSWYTLPPELWSQEQRDTQAATNALMIRDDFWSNIPPTEGAHELLAASFARADTYLLTALPSGVDVRFHDNIRRQKIQSAWQKLHVPPERIICVARPDKVRYAWDHFNIVQNVLIDDAEQNVREWIDHDGIAHLFTDSACAVDFVKCL